jgi:N-dimethylarginine dimethylaminohydrolase
VRREFDPLLAVLLSVPGDEFLQVRDPDEWLMLEPIDAAALGRQARGLASFYESRGIEVCLHEPLRPPPPNFIFQRDLFFMTPEGVVLSRMASLQRAGEERFAAEALASIGIPILHTIRGEGTFEGADAIWLDEKTVLAGVGIRTNPAGFVQVARVLEEMGARALSVELPAGIQHLLGIFNLADEDLAVVRKDTLTPGIRKVLADRGIRALELPPDDEVLCRLSMNFVTLEPRRILMPAGCPWTRETFERAGIACHEVEVGEYVKAAGGPGCATGILRRG